jgi:hypothetical protein
MRLVRNTARGVLCFGTHSQFFIHFHRYDFDCAEMKRNMNNVPKKGSRNSQDVCTTHNAPHRAQLKFTNLKLLKICKFHIYTHAVQIQSK